jgi:hypothetical protein
MLGGADTRSDRDVFLQWNTREHRKPGHQPPPIPEWVCSTLSVSEQQVRQSQRQQTRTVVTTDGWRFSYHPELQDHQMFNLNDDPLERTNLAGDPVHLDRMNNLLDRIRCWQEEVGDDVKLPEAAAIARQMTATHRKEARQ